jgi:hypothetical protein
MFVHFPCVSGRELHNQFVELTGSTAVLTRGDE